MVWRHVMLALPTVLGVPDHVLDRVGRVARGLDAELELFHSAYSGDRARSGSGASLDSVIRAHVEEKRRDLERVADRLRDQGLEVSASVRWDFPLYEAMVREVLRRGPDLLIVPATHIGRADARTLSYTDARLIETCPCPLLLLKTDQVYAEGPIIAAVDPLHAHEKPAGLDDRIVAAAKTLSRALSPAAIHLYHAVAPLAPAANGEVPGEQAEQGETAGTTARRERESADWAAREQAIRGIAHRHGLSDHLVYVELAEVESSLPAYAREMRASAVVMGAVSRSYPGRALFGYTAENVLDALDCDVLIVKPEGFRTPVSRRPRRRVRGSRASQPQDSSPVRTPVQPVR
jgi:universal stress protein E